MKTTVNLLATTGILLSSCFAVSAGTVVSWGDGSWGQGIGQPTATNLMAVAAGQLFSMALTADGTVVAWGNNGSSQTNVPADLSNVVAIAAGGYFGAAVKSDGTVTGWGAAPSGLSDLSNIVAVAGGMNHLLALRGDGIVVARGDNTYGQCNVPGGLSNVVAVAAGNWHSYALKSDGNIAAWGVNGEHELDAPQTGRAVDIASGRDHGLALTADGTLYTWGDADWMQHLGFFIYPPNAGDWAVIGSGDFHFLGATVDGNAAAWGYNNYGQAAVPAGLTNIQDVAGGVYHSIALVGDGTPRLVNPRWGIRILPETVVSDESPTLYVQATGAAPLTYYWMRNGSNCLTTTSPRLILTNVQPDQAGFYSVVVSNALGVAATTNIAQLQVLPLQITGQPVSQSVFEAADVNFCVSALGTALTYRWRFNSTDLPGQTNAALSLPLVQTNQAGAYSVLVSNLYSSQISSNATLMIAVPQITTHPADQIANAGNAISFTVAANDPALRYQWQFNGTNLPAGTNAVLMLDPVTSTDSGVYGALVTNVYRVLASSNAVLTVVPLTFLTQPAGQTVYSGDNAAFSVTVQGNGPFSYQWRYQGADLTDATNTSLILTNLDDARSGNYSVVVSNSYGSLESSNALLTVLDTVPIILSQPANQVTWPGGNATFQVNATGSKPLSYQWRFKETNADGATNATFSLAGVGTNQAGSYYVVVSNAVGSISSSSATLTLISVASWGDTNYNLSTLPASLTNAIAIAAGYNHSLALKPNGTVVTWGSTPPPFGLTNVAAIVAGYNQSLALKSNGTVVVWGYGTLSSVPAGLSNVVALAMGYSQYSPMQNACLALKSDGTVVGWGNLNTAIINVPPGLNGITAIAAGAYHALALRSDGTVTAWLDYSDYNANRVPANLSSVVQVAAGLRHSLALKADGTVVAWGQDWYGATIYGVTNVPAGLSNVVNIAAGDYHSLALKSDGTVVSWGYNYYGQTNVPTSLSNVVSVAGGGYHSLALIGSTKPAIVRQPKSATSLPRQPVLLSVGVVSQSPVSYQWQHDGQDIVDGTNSFYCISSLVRTSQGGYRVVVSNAFLVVTSTVAQVTMSGNIVIAWGSNFYGQTNVPPGLNATAIAGGNYHSLALRPDGGVVGWGNNSYHQTNVPAAATNVTAISAGYDHSLALKANSTVVAWGNNSSGQTNVPANLTNAVTVAAGYGYSLALKSDGKIIQWGSLNPGSLPTGLSNVVAIATGGSHGLALKSDGTAVAWGHNSSGQCNVPSGLSNVVAIAGGYLHSLALSANGTITAWGRNDYGQTNVPDGLSNVVVIAAGDESGLALKSDGTAVAWGLRSNPPGGNSNLVGIADGGSHGLMLVGSADPAIVRQPAPAYASVFGRVLLSVGAAGSQPLSYQWRTNGVPIPGATNSWLDLPTALPADSGIYSVVVSNTLGVAISSNSTVNVVARAPFILTQPLGQTNLGGATATFQTAAGGSLPFNYQWQKDAAGLLDATNPALTLNTLTRSNSGAYSVIVSNAFGFVTSSNAMLRVMVPQQLQSPMINPDGSMTFGFSDSDGGLLSSNDVAYFAVSASTNLVDWQVLSNTPLLINGMLWLQDFDATNFPQRFYRVIENP